VSDAPRKDGAIARGRPFAKGNPGKPPGTRAKVSVLAERMYGDETGEIVRAIIDAAIAGDPTAMKLCADRISPVLKSRPMVLDIGDVVDGESALAAIERVIAMVAAGNLAPDEGAATVGLIRQYFDAFEAAELEARIRKLEERS
jgi:hypothetical protein